MSLLRRIRAILEKAPPEQDPRDIVIEQQDREIGRLRDELVRHKDVHRENGRVHRQNDGLQRQIERLERENEHLKQQLATERRAGRRQAAPFAKKRPQGRGGRFGRRPGTRYNRQGRRACPAHVDEAKHCGTRGDAARARQRRGSTSGRQAGNGARSRREPERAGSERDNQSRFGSPYVMVLRLLDGIDTTRQPRDLAEAHETGKGADHRGDGPKVLNHPGPRPGPTEPIRTRHSTPRRTVPA